MGSLENTICCESSVGKAFNGSSRLDEIISSLLDNRDDALLPISEEGLVREDVTLYKDIVTSYLIRSRR